MKKTLLLLIAVMMASMAAHADLLINETTFPDANFRAYMMSEYPSGVIPSIDLIMRTELDLSSKQISDATGIKHFRNLTHLDLYSNNLSSIDVSQNTKLTYLNVGYNHLTTIDVTNNRDLEELYCQHNQFTTLQITDMPRLRTFWVFKNPSLTGLYCWRNVLTSLDVSDCPELIQLKCYNNANLNKIYGLAGCTKLTWLDCEDCSFSTLPELSSLTNLETLLVGNNYFTSLDVSEHYYLKSLYSAGNSRLTELYCGQCRLSTLRITNCTALTKLYCYGNHYLETITGLATCTALENVSCYSCSLTSLDELRNMNNLQTLVCSANKLVTLTLTELPNLRQIWVDDNALLTSLDCYRNDLTSLNVTNCTALTSLDCMLNHNLPEIMGLETCSAITYLNCIDCSLTDLSSVANMPNLQFLYCFDNHLTSLDVSSNNQLLYLHCYKNDLTSLNVSGCTAMTSLQCYDNENLPEITGLETCTAMNYLDCENCALTSLPVSGMNDLAELLCRSNQFETLLVNEKPNLTVLGVSDNPSLINLECYSCALTELDVSNCPSLYYLDCSDNQLSSLDVGDGPSLSFLNCSENQLSSLDISQCPELYYLLCNTNQLSEIDLSGTKVSLLWCNNNQLTSLDLSPCPDSFYSLDCRQNQISGSLDFANFPDMYQLFCSYNEITQLKNVANHTSLLDINCHANELTSLDASGCSNLEVIACAGNHLSELRADNCPMLWSLQIYYNKIKAPKMGQLVADLPTRSADDMGIIYVIGNYGALYEEANVITVPQVNEATAKYWNVVHYDNQSGWQPYAGSEFELGDLNSDGLVNVTDVTILINLLANGNPSASEYPTADMDGNGYVNITDATILINEVLNSTMKLAKPKAEGSKNMLENKLLIDSDGPTFVERKPLRR